jgi:catechol 2,3-dioxygenase-like lactoylglutathione lyase family enzyme
MIGRFLELSLQADDILASVEFYERLGFRQLQVGETWSHPYAVLSDGRIHIGLHRYEFESPALTFVLADLAAKLPHIERNGVTFKFRKLGADEFNEAGLVAPASQMIALLEARTYSPPSFDDVDFSRLGRLAEWSVPVHDLEGAVPVWESLGFRLAGLHDEPHPRALLSGQDIAVGLHERPALKRPALCFTCKELDRTMSYLIEQGLHLDPERSPVDGGPGFVLVSPEGLRILLCPDPA